MKLKDIVCNRNFDVNCNYVVVWNDDGECLWDSSVMGTLCEDDRICTMNVTYMTIDTNRMCLVIEVE